MTNFQRFLENSKKRVGLIVDQINSSVVPNLEPMIYEFSSIIAVESDFSIDNFTFLNITGTAVKPGMWHDSSHKPIIFKADELKKATMTLKGKPLYYEHGKIGNSTPIGEVTDVWYDEKDDEIKYRAFITNKEYAMQVHNGDLQHVSVKAFSFRTSIDNNIPVGQNIWFTELSLVKRPAIDGTTIEVL